MFETGAGVRNPLFFVGVVENNVDERLEGRVQVRAFGVHGTTADVPTESLPWAILIAGNYDPNVPIPPLNSWVFGFFVDGRDAQQPMILGLIPTQMTEPIDPAKNGWGVIPKKDMEVLAQGSRPQDYGQPANSRLARGENIEETHVLQHEANRVTGVSGGGDKTWEEPGSAYNAQYPYNRVIETAAGHSIELDDTPGAERIMIWHKSGSYVQIDSRGTTTEKSVSDKYEINEMNSHIYIGGKSYVVIEGDAYVKVNGNKTEEITGDLTQLVHQNYHLSVAGQLNLNGSDDIQMRAAKVRIESNVENVNIKSAKIVGIQSGKTIEIKSAEDIHIQSDKSIHKKAGVSIFTESKTSTNIKAENIFIESTASSNIKSGTNLYISGEGISHFKGSETRISAGNKLSLRGVTVAIDDIVHLANGEAIAALQASASTGADSAGTIESTDLPEPAAKSVGTSSNPSNASGGGSQVVPASYRNPSSIGTTGYTSKDDTGSGTAPLDNSVTTGMLQPLLNLIGYGEGAGYNTVYGGSAIQPPKPITSMTISELLNWQSQSIAAGSISTASGRYQIIKGTLNTIVSAGVFGLSDTYSPINQDNACIYLLKVRGLNKFITGVIDEYSFANNLAKEWASFPVASGPNSGYSFYSGIAGNKARVSISEVLTVLTNLKTASSSSSSNLMA